MRARRALPSRADYTPEEASGPSMHINHLRAQVRVDAPFGRRRNFPRSSGPGAGRSPPHLCVASALFLNVFFVVPRELQLLLFLAGFYFEPFIRTGSIHFRLLYRSVLS